MHPPLYTDVRRLGLTGPAMPVMLNCSASLVTMKQVVASLRQGEVDLALVGGVNAIFSPRLTREMAELGMLSRQGRCKTFDASTDGFVRSEGCAMVALKRMDEAEAASALVTKRETCLRKRVNSSRRAGSGHGRDTTHRDAHARSGESTRRPPQSSCAGSGRDRIPRSSAA